jgi:RimJ/RimL family protein N-acetyltransferase
MIAAGLAGPPGHNGDITAHVPMVGADPGLRRGAVRIAGVSAEGSRALRGAGRAGPSGRSGVRMRPAGPGDAAALLALKQRLDRETSFMLLEPSERDADVPALARELEDTARSGNSVVIVAEAGSELAGYVELAGGGFRRSRATALVVIGVLAAASGRGIGGGLLAEAKRWAAGHGLHRLELTVMAHNRRAIELYQRAGFAIEGRRTECLLIDGDFVDELYMAIVLSRESAD